MGQHTEQVTEIGLGIQAVETRGGDQREEIASNLGMSVAADEQLRLAADGDAAELALGGIVVEAQPAVVVEAVSGPR
jgi:hypothetical protein